MSTIDEPASYEALKKALPELIATADYAELYGLDFAATAPFSAAHEKVLHKFLRANKYEIEPAKEQLLKTLVWRKEYNPLDAATNVDQHKPELNHLGVVTEAPDGKIITWNLYGAIKDRASVFADLEPFIRWRVGLMERGIALLDLSSDELGTMDQVHDYMDVSFLRMDSTTKKASSTVIKLFQDYYPEFLSAKYFVNVPYLMTWVFSFARAFMSKETADKFHVLGNGKDLRYTLGDWVPKAYGGNGAPLLEQAVDPAAAEVAREEEAEMVDAPENEPNSTAVSEPKSTAIATEPKSAVPSAGAGSAAVASDSKDGSQAAPVAAPVTAPVTAPTAAASTPTTN